MNQEKNGNSRQLTNYKTSISALAVYCAIFAIPLFMFCTKETILNNVQARQEVKEEILTPVVSLNEMERMSIIEFGDEIKFAIYDEGINVHQNGEVDGAGAFAMLYVDRDYIDDKDFNFEHSKDERFCKLEYSPYVDLSAFGARLTEINTPIFARLSKSADGEFALEISYTKGLNSDYELSFEGRCEQELFYDDRYINFEVSVESFHEIFLNSGF